MIPMSTEFIIVLMVIYLNMCYSYCCLLGFNSHVGFWVWTRM